MIFSVVRIPIRAPLNDDSKMEVDDDDDNVDLSLSPEQKPWTFVHEERPNAPATFLENTLKATNLRAWDFVTGEALASDEPVVFSYAEDEHDRRAFMMVSRSAGSMVKFKAPGEGDILGMGANAIVHRVQLSVTKADGGIQSSGSFDIQPSNHNESEIDEDDGHWDAAVKRPFSLSKMIVFLQNSSEAGLAKRLRLANLLNSDKRVLYFYGLGLGLSTNAYNENEYKFELMLLAKYEPDFSTYTLRCFIEEYIAVPSTITNDKKRLSIIKLQSEFTLTSIKVFLVSLLNAFRDLTLMGIQGSPRLYCFVLCCVISVFNTKTR